MPSEFHNQLIATLPKLRPYSLVLAGNRAAADDLLQEAACRALAAKAQFTPGTNFKAWMHRILRNEFISTFRRAKRNPSSIDAVSEAFLARDGDQENKFLAKEIMEAMGSIPTAQREVLMLSCVSGLTYEEIAETLSCSVGTVKSRLWRARHFMRALLLGEGSVANPPNKPHGLTPSDRLAHHPKSFPLAAKKTRRTRAQIPLLARAAPIVQSVPLFQTYGGFASDIVALPRHAASGDLMGVTLRRIKAAS